MKKSLIEKYAYTIARVGLNIQKGQKVLVECDIEGHYFAPYFASEAYKLGASEVIFNYLDLPTLKIDAMYQNYEDVVRVEDWQKGRYLKYLEEGACVLRLEGVNTKLMEDLKEEEANAVFGFVDNMRNVARSYASKSQWCIAMVPSVPWAKQLFPELNDKEAFDKLWETVLKLCYIDETTDIVKVWEEKNKVKKQIGEKLDSLNLRNLHYTSSNGTDLYIGLTELSKYAYGSKSEIPFNPNIPTEEIATVPDKYQTNGVVYSTRPLVLGGKAIDNFGFRFENGRVVEVLADEGKTMLESLVNTDEGSCYLGEAALVEYDSPISQSGLVYYTTLIDENASCHLALGRALGSNGDPRFNQSQIHIDFMIGAKDTRIVGTDVDGNQIVIFDNGNFAI